MGLMESREMRHAYQLDYSLHMLSEIAVNYDSTVNSDQTLTAHCMIDSFFVHIRLLTDFLARPTKPIDFGPGEFGVEWTIPNTPEVERLLGYWTAASKFVVHFGHSRVPDKPEDLNVFEISGKRFKDMAKDALTVFAEFLQLLEAGTPEWTNGAIVPDRVASPDMWNSRNLHQRRELLRRTFTEACERLGLDGELLLGSASDEPRANARP